ncbi:YkuJ family protein [Jeotgalibacillus soli]|uniref:DUF1797 family protein n=1 Tax=Jeotgalibacillus soli TaxID=889306 RepID=A0A0C2V6W6_9BACL|nr:YkuJ family protein [Jeotgalibacillus soli]KIL44707.1 hypothetical protein KP78_22510 [Jeotgalibacillus soli]
MSQLMGIIQRLKTLQEQDDSGDIQSRFFEVNGKRICQVKYFSATDTFELEVYSKDKKPQKYPFDNIDMTAIEIYELLQEENEL